MRRRRARAPAYGGSPRLARPPSRASRARSLAHRSRACCSLPSRPSTVPTPRPSRASRPRRCAAVAATAVDPGAAGALDDGRAATGGAALARADALARFAVDFVADYEGRGADDDCRGSPRSRAALADAAFAALSPLAPALATGGAAKGGTAPSSDALAVACKALLSAADDADGRALDEASTRARWRAYSSTGSGGEGGYRAGGRVASRSRTRCRCPRRRRSAVLAVLPPGAVQGRKDLVVVKDDKLPYGASYQSGGDNAPHFNTNRGPQRRVRLSGSPRRRRRRRGEPPTPAGEPEQLAPVGLPRSRRSARRHGPRPPPVATGGWTGDAGGADEDGSRGGRWRRAARVTHVRVGVPTTAAALEPTEAALTAATPRSYPVQATRARGSASATAWRGRPIAAARAVRGAVQCAGRRALRARKSNRLGSRRHRAACGVRARARRRLRSGRPAARNSERSARCAIRWPLPRACRREDRPARWWLRGGRPRGRSRRSRARGVAGGCRAATAAAPRRAGRWLRVTRELWSSAR